MSIYAAPLSPLDRIIKRPFEHVLSVALILLAIALTVQGAGVLFFVGSRVVEVAWAVTSISAGMMTLLGLQWKTATMGLALERVGWTIAAITLLGGAAIILWHMPAWGIVWALRDTIAIGIGAILRERFIKREQVARRVVEGIIKEAEEAVGGDL